jgi:prepilin-type N-terminal cleavage/methylation domain-containing protein
LKCLAAPVNELSEELRGKHGTLASRRASKPLRSGMTMLEILVALSILAVGLLSAATVAVRCGDLQRSTNAYIKAQNTSRDVLERIRNGDMIAQFQTFRAAPTFVQEGQQVEVSFPEELLVRILGMAVPATVRFRDANGDGEVDLNAAATEPASLLPIRITVRDGTLAYRLESVLTEI